MNEKIKDIFECLKKYANLTPDAIDDLHYLEGTIESLQQKVEQLENIRKEAIDYMKEFIFEPLLINEDRKLIMYNENLKNFENILNKGDNKNKIKGEKHE